MGTVWRVSQAGRGRGRGGEGREGRGGSPWDRLRCKKNLGWDGRGKMGWGLHRPSLFSCEKTRDPCPASAMYIDL